MGFQLVMGVPINGWFFVNGKPHENFRMMTGDSPMAEETPIES